MSESEVSGKSLAATHARISKVSQSTKVCSSLSNTCQVSTFEKVESPE